MKLGIVGFSASGKTTLFNALTGQDAPTGFGGGKINLGTIKVPDSRLDRLAQINQTKKTIYSEITFADVPGGRGRQSLDPQTLGRIREMDALVQVVRGFDDGSGSVSPVSELRSFEAELILGDMQVVEKRVERLRKDLSDPRQLSLLSKCLDEMSAALGPYIPLIIVNCIIICRAEACASKNNLLISIIDALGMGIGFTITLCVLASIREILATGKLDLIFTTLSLPDAFVPWAAMGMPVGAFLTLGLLLGLVNLITAKKNKG